MLVLHDLSGNLSGRLVLALCTRLVPQAYGLCMQEPVRTFMVSPQCPLPSAKEIRFDSVCEDSPRAIQSPR